MFTKSILSINAPFKKSWKGSVSFCYYLAFFNCLLKRFILRLGVGPKVCVWNTKYI